MRKSSGDLETADRAYERLSGSSKEVVSSVAEYRTLWAKLVKKVGPERAVEYVEVLNLIGQVDATKATLIRGLADWQLGKRQADEVVRAIRAVGAEGRQKILESVEYIGSLGGTLSETDAVTEAAERTDENSVDAAIAFVLGLEISTPAAAIVMMIDRQWTAVCDAWDAKTRRRRLPLVNL